MVAGIKEKAIAHDDAKATAQKNTWAKGQAKLELLAFRKRRKRGKDEKLEEMLEQIRMEESSLQVEVMRRWLSELARRELRRNDGKGSSVPRKKDEDAAAATEFFVDKGERKPVESTRKGGYCIAGESWERKSRN